MKRNLIILAALMSFLSLTVAGQGFTPPPPGKAVIYFARVSSYGLGASFDFFHGDKYIGAFNGQEYMRYECDPGEQLFWASSENKEFLTADLLEGGSYIVIVDVIIGFWKAHVGLTPVSVAEKELYARARDLILENPPVFIPDSQIEKMSKKLASFIPKELEAYEKDKSAHNYKHIAPDMAIPEKAMHY